MHNISLYLQLWGFGHRPHRGSAPQPTGGLSLYRPLVFTTTLPMVCDFSSRLQQIKCVGCQKATKKNRKAS